MHFVLLFFGELFILFFLSKILTNNLSQLLHHVTRNKKVAMYLSAFLFLPGTLLHEISHYVMAVLLFVPAGKLELMPRMEKDGVRLGSVTIAKTDPIRRSLIGMAPFLFGGAIILAVLFTVTEYINLNSPLVALLLGYIVFAIGNTMFSSKKDMEGTLELFLFIAIICGLLYLTGFRLPTFDPETVIPPAFIDVCKRGGIFLLFPLAIDVIAITFLKILRLLKVS